MVALPSRPAPALGSLADAVLAVLTEHGRADSVDGAAALHAARLLDAGGLSGAAIAATLKEMRAAATAATKGALVGTDLVDELRAKRAGRRAG